MLQQTRVMTIPNILSVRHRAPAAAAGAAAYYSVDYNGTTTRIDGGHGASIADIAAGNFTAECWLKPTGWGESTLGGQVFSKYSSSYSAGWELTLRSSSSRYEAYIKTSTGYEGGNFEPDTSPDSAWHHVAVTFTGAGSKVISFFFDGIKSVTTISVTGAPSADEVTSNWSIGALQDGSRTFAGAIGWIRLSNSVRYTANFAPIARCLPPATDGNTLALYRLTEGSGTSVADSSGNGNTGTLENGAWSLCS